MLIRIILLLSMLTGFLRLEAQPYTISEYAVPSLSKSEIRAIIRDRTRLHTKVDELTTTNARLRAYIDGLEGRVTVIRAQGEQTAAERLEYIRLNAKYVNLITQLRSNVTTLELLLEGAEKKADELGGVIVDLRDQVAQQQSTLAELQEELTRFKEMATALEIELLYREAALVFLERSFSVASIDVFRIQGSKSISVDRNSYKRGLRRKDEIEIHLWTYTFDKAYEKAAGGKGLLLLHVPGGKMHTLRVSFIPANMINRRVKKKADVVAGLSSGYGMLYRMQKNLELEEYLDKANLRKGKATTIPYQVILPNGDRYYDTLKIRR